MIADEFKMALKNFVLLAFVASALSNLSLANAAELRRGGTLRFGVARSPSTLNPFVLVQSVNHRIRSLLYENLLAIDKNLNPIPALASSWEISSRSDDAASRPPGFSTADVGRLHQF